MRDALLEEWAVESRTTAYSFLSWENRMIPIDPGSKYGQLVEFARDQDEYQTLLARLHDDGDSILTRWQLTEDERLALASGADFNLRIWTFGTPLQPVKLYVAGIDPDDPNIASERIFPEDEA